MRPAITDFERLFGFSESRKSFFQRQLRQDIAASIAAEVRQVLVLDMQRGSIVVDVCLLPPLRSETSAQVSPMLTSQPPLHESGNVETVIEHP